MANTFKRTPYGADGFTVTSPEDNLLEGTLVKYDQVTETITLALGNDFNAITIGNSSGTEGSQKVAINVLPEKNKEWWVRLSGTVSKGDAIEASLIEAGTAVVAVDPGVAILTAMSAGIAGDIIPCQEKL